MNLAIDLGNSSVKAGCFENGKLVGEVHQPEFDDLSSWISSVNPRHTIISSVNQDANELAKRIKGKVVLLNYMIPLPFKINYATPNTLGKDRIAAVAGAHAQQPNTNTLVVDIGSCITYDFINNDNEYMGGGISPGLEMKLKAMHTFTAGLPLVDVNFEVDLVGDTTEKALQSGVIYGTIAEIEEIIRMYNDKFPHLRFVICGGGAEYISSRLRTRVEVYPELVLTGLNGILEYNV